jgi:hypothetical protein
MNKILGLGGKRRFSVLQKYRNKDTKPIFTPNSRLIMINNREVKAFYFIKLYTLRALDIATEVYNLKK